MIISNAALQWIPDHPARARAAGPPRSPSTASSRCRCPPTPTTRRTGSRRKSPREQPFLDAFGGEPPPDPVLGVGKPEEYAVLLDALGFTEQHVRLQVYPHHLASTADVVEWVKGTSLTRFKERLSPEQFDAFVDRYRARLVEELGDQRPYLYTFKRILLWGRRAEAGVTRAGSPWRVRWSARQYASASI